VLGMFRTKVDVGLTEKEVRRRVYIDAYIYDPTKYVSQSRKQQVLARRDVYGDNRPPPVAKASALRILLRQLADFIVLILLAGPWRLVYVCVMYLI
jgi:hypothetical protein